MTSRLTRYPSDYNPIREYWSAIESGQEIVSSKVRRTYAKVVRDLDDPCGAYFYSHKRANHVIEFFENYCHHSKGKSGGQSKDDNDFYYAKEQEKDALRDQLDAAKDSYQAQIDNAPTWAAERVAAIEAAEARRKAAEEEASRKEQQRWEQEIAQMEAVQKMAAGALAAAGNVVNQVTNAITKVTNNNKVSITTGASMLTSGQMARAAEKAIEKLAK